LASDGGGNGSRFHRQRLQAHQDRANQLNLNGGRTVTNGLTVWDSDLGDVDIEQGTLGFQRRMTMGV